ncbi:DNA-J related domain-containing protein [Aliikangiella sp. G2MR2-5]|uniref:DNA-J related domain-containing protein n=1 Tax=Aliikangiella sp. G2MR2-5 TaxID=2788943 RepID=UPI0018A94AAB|nr:DNA-J related domain-containing protein [Aliikangiella sp. G2MR2-5]
MNQELLLDYINQNDGVTQEYPLLRHLEESHPEFFAPLGIEPSLFKRHFYLFHQLYKLNNRLLEKRLRLIISPLEIRLCSIAEAGQSIAETDALAEFYLDRKNLELSASEVAEMQKKFWEKYLAIDKKAVAIRTLGLTKYEELDRKLVKRQYSKLAQSYHPDKGGDEAEFQKIKEAYETLMILFK